MTFRHNVLLTSPRRLLIHLFVESRKQPDTMSKNSTADASITVLSQQTVTCSNDASYKSLSSPFRLGPLDQLVAPVVPVAVAFLYKADQNGSECISLDRFTPALERLLDYYPHLTGRLNLETSDKSYTLKELGAGITLVSAECNQPLSFFHSSTVTPITLADLPEGGNTLFAPFDFVDGIFRDPVMTVQHTRFQGCGSVFIGVRILHKLCDADGIFQVVRDLAEIYRKMGDGANQPELDKKPTIVPWLAEVSASTMKQEEVEKALKFQPELFYLEKPVVEASGDIVLFPSEETAASRPPPPVTGRFMRFSGPELAALKQLATEPDGKSWVSTFEALTAHLYQRVHVARLELRRRDPLQAPLSPPDFLTPVNIRSRLPLPPKYFGNALITTFIQPSSETVARAPLWEIAKLIHEMTRTPGSNDKTELENSHKWIALQPDKSIIRQGFRFGNGCFMASQWNKVDVFEGTTFDSRPILVSSPFTVISLVDGLVYYLATEEQGTEKDTGAIDVNMSLSDPLWAILDKDPEFRRFRGR